jgi:transposase
MTSPEMQIRSERIDDMPVLIERLKQMRVAEIIDETVGRHHLWEGMSKGWTSLVWLAHIIMTGDHRKVHVRRMLNECRESLSRLLGEEVRESEFNDDRLGRILAALGQQERAEEIERAMNKHCIRYYRLKTDKPVARIDTTSVSVYGGDDGSDVIVHGYSKDHRPDLMQFKVLMVTLDPLGMPLATQMVAGNASDDGLYVPAYAEAAKSIGTDVMVVGDSKMGALGTRAYIQGRGGITSHHWQWWGKCRNRWKNG